MSIFFGFAGLFSVLMGIKLNQQNVKDFSAEAYAGIGVILLLLAMLNI